MIISPPGLLGVLRIGFLPLRVVPTHPATVRAGPTTSKADVDAIPEQMGLNEPLLLQFGLYLSRVLQLNLGRSMISNRPLIEEPPAQSTRPWS